MKTKFGMTFDRVQRCNNFLLSPDAELPLRIADSISRAVDTLLLTEEWAQRLKCKLRSIMTQDVWRSPLFLRLGFIRFSRWCLLPFTL